ncbi:DUF2726 domain-containing protein [Vitreoscilla massiliensis]|uniref:DUF2726 domain-containing protein n=1 Tax=Vitreoscilla massiliensis TaxID=1689272 RepID=A0ABY4E1D9_9NEIS|nr:DUF2726 domain-containing protein [Vitreoscilla massiliensis]UOO89165.1 DUF2726 domain-containing protein [Vitreoscilla massiliensis]
MEIILGIAIVCIAAIVGYVIFLNDKGTKKKTPNPKFEAMRKASEEKQLFENPTARGMAISKSTYEQTELINKGEFYCYLTLNHIISKHKLKLIVCPQVPLRAFIKQTASEKPKDLHGGFYVDFVLINYDRKPVVVIEVDGGGHSKQSDFNKELILRNADITCLRVNTAGFDNTEKYSNFIIKKVHESTGLYFQNLAQNNSKKPSQTVSNEPQLS